MKTYKDFQIILLVKKPGLSHVKPMRLSQRSSLGCLTCKRKKIKCDESKWTCKKCTASRLECTWPEKVLKLHSQSSSSEEPADEPKPLDPTSQESYTWPELSEATESVTNTLLQETTSMITVPERTPDQFLGGIFENQLDPIASTPEVLASPPTFGPNVSFQEIMDCEFLRHFSQNFLPAIAQTHFFDSNLRENLMLSGAGSSEVIRGIFVACGAISVAYEDNSYKGMALDRCNTAIRAYLDGIKRAETEGNEDWLLVAVQVLQTLCYRDFFTTSNVTRAATHFAVAYDFISSKIYGQTRGNPSDSVKVLKLDLIMIENFVFNYSITIMFCDHESLPRLVMNPYVLFSQANNRLKELYLCNNYPAPSQISILAFLIAAKCSWLCRLCLPLSPQEHILSTESLLTAEVALLSLSLLSAAADSIAMKKTISVARVVLETCRILLGLMIDSQHVQEKIQDHVNSIREDIAQAYNEDTIFPVWTLFIAGSASVLQEDREFFRGQLQRLMNVSRSMLVRLISQHLEKVWLMYSGLEPLDLLLDTRVLDRVCK